MSDTRTAAPAQRSSRGVSPLVTVAALVGFVLLAQAAGLVGLPFTDRAIDGWYDGLDKPSFNPPSWVFGPVWTVLYLLIGVAAWMVWRHHDSPRRGTALTWWGLQLLLNAAWTPLFFGARALWVALIELAVLWVAVILTIGEFRRIDRIAAWMMVPYLAWISFAGVLNGSLAVMN